MFLQRGSRVLRRQLQTSKAMGKLATGRGTLAGGPTMPRWFTESRSLYAVKPVLLADIGEGIVECEVIQWFVEPGARVEEFSPLCEVQSDKASVEITSRFTGTVKKLYYDAGEMAKVGKPFVDIDIEGDAEPEAPAPSQAQQPLASAPSTPSTPSPSEPPSGQGGAGAVSPMAPSQRSGDDAPAAPKPKGKMAALATPASMTRSLNIPHFLYADEIDFTSLVALRARLNKVLASSTVQGGQPDKLSYLPFIIKAVSMALYQFPILNARVEVDSPGANGKPALIMRSQHNIGVAMDTPQGLLVPVIKDVGSRNIISIAAELVRLQKLAHQGKLTPADMSGGTITVSNIGNIGGTYLSPVIVEKEVSILGIGRMRTVPAFDGNDNVVKKHVCNFSWSADHRVVDGATMARAAEVVRTVVEEPDIMVMHLR
ncbi:Lipoamide acyltransferase component of branched-chain alpha-keto acid dehydrogenase complex, mitochondrial [Metarhizium anisopliae]